ncbi:MAG: hypothetical protein GX657_03920 [Chloroflexi bacterium]|jgi:hypothetical protein|nr:hypothetical protein [Chloroflexota bacterium]
MDYALEQNRASWRSVLATLLWVIVAVGGLSLIMALQPILFAVGKATISGEATSVVMDKYRIVSARNLGLVAYGMVWLAGIIGLHSYYVNAKSVRQLFYRFGAVALGELAVWGIGYAAQVLTMR